MIVIDSCMLDPTHRFVAGMATPAAKFFSSLDILFRTTGLC